VITLGVSDLERSRPLNAAPAQFSIGHLVAEKHDVDALLAAAVAAGGTLTEEPHGRPWGIYSGYFRDPDGHLWEIIWNPRAGSV
jgi:catechol 2,3-dioxygenase-like lactoylglutathione lyase family enzyme